MQRYLLSLLFIVIFCPTMLFGQNQLLDSLRQVYSHQETDSAKVVVLNEIAFNKINIDPIAAKDDVTVSLEIANTINFKAGQARALSVLGGVHWGVGDYEKALAYYLESLKAYQEIGDNLGRSKILNNIGEVYKKLDEYENAQNYLLHSLNLKIELLGKDKAILAYINLGELYTLMKDFDKAEKYFNDALGIVQNSNDLRSFSYIYDGLGNLFAAQQDYDRAIYNYRKALHYREQNNDFRGLSYVFTHLGNTYKILGNFDSASFYLGNALVNAQKSKSNDVRLDLYELKAELDSLRGDYKASLANYVAHIQLKDSLFDLQKAFQMARLQTEYENELLRKENEAKEAEVKQKNTLIIAVIMLMILTLALANAFYQQRLVQNRANKELLEKNQKIEKQSEELLKQAAKLQILNDNLESLNHNLEEKIKQRTKLLIDQNKVLAEYAFIHAHRLRAPLANIMGLVELLKHSSLAKNEHVIVNHLTAATTELDSVIRNITDKVEGNADIKYID